MQEITRNEPHQQRLARLSWELETRKMLSQQLEKVQKEKEEIEKDIETKVSQLDTLQPKLEALLEVCKNSSFLVAFLKEIFFFQQASRPLQEILDMNYEKDAIQRSAARFLPKPLFYAYIQAVAYKEVFGKPEGSFVVFHDPVT